MNSCTLLVAATLSNGIGAGGSLPWRLPKEMAYFLRASTSCPSTHRNAVIMGRKTWESIPPRFKPLQNRFNIVISRNPEFNLEKYPSDQVTTRSDLDSAILASPPDTSLPLHKRFIIGGAEIYTQSLTLRAVTRILLTRIISPSFEQCAVFMPEFRTTTQAQTESTAEGVLGPVPEEGEWRKCSYEEMDQWLGFSVAKGINEDKGVQYVFQMWERR